MVTPQEWGAPWPPVTALCYPSPAKGTGIPQQKWLAPRPAQGIFKMNLEHLEVLESKKIIKKRPLTLTGISQKDTSTKWRSSQ